MEQPHACNPSYSGGRDQEDTSSKPARANSYIRPYPKKKPSQKKDPWGGSRCIGPEFKVQYHQKKKEKRVLRAYT
jgi:hypothetical protein